MRWELAAPRVIMWGGDLSWEHCGPVNVIDGVVTR